MKRKKEGANVGLWAFVWLLICWFSLFSKDDNIRFVSNKQIQTQSETLFRRVSIDCGCSERKGNWKLKIKRKKRDKNSDYWRRRKRGKGCVRARICSFFRLFKDHEATVPISFPFYAHSFHLNSFSWSEMNFSFFITV